MLIAKILAKCLSAPGIMLGTGVRTGTRIDTVFAFPAPDYLAVAHLPGELHPSAPAAGGSSAFCLSPFPMC